MSAQPPLVAVLGATGRLGRHVITLALGRGYRVRAIVHRTRVESSHPLLVTWPADVRRPETVHDALAGADLVISCLGSASAESPTVQTLGGSALREAMTALSLTRLVSVTGSGTTLPGEPLTPHHQAKRNQMLAVAPHLLADGDRHLATLAATSLAWTVVRVPLMTHGQQKTVTPSSHRQHRPPRPWPTGTPPRRCSPSPPIPKAGYAPSPFWRQL
jgi:putative NADH-flavin reductase